MRFTDLINEKKVVFFDGAMGTSLQTYLSSDTPPEKLNLTLPDKVKQVHYSYIKEGVHVIETNTFGANRVKLEKYNLGRFVKDINYQAVKLAKEIASPSSVLVGASVGPLGDLIQPWGQITAHQAFEVFKEQIEILVEAGVDLIVIETMMHLKEAKIAVMAAKEVSNIPVVCQLTFNEEGKTLTGSDPEIMTATLEKMDVEVVGANCSVGPREMLSVAEQMSLHTKKFLIFQPNAGKPYIKDGKTIFPVKPKEFSEWMIKFIEKGAKIVGGCCGTTPLHIRAMIAKVKDIPSPADRKVHILKGLSSRTKFLHLGEKESFKVGANLMISPGLNEEKLRERLIEIKEKAFSFINVSWQNRKEGEISIGHFINLIQETVDLPVTLEVAIHLLEKSLEEIEGKPAVLSNEHDEKSIEIARKWGAMVGIKIPIEEDKTDLKEKVNLLEEKFFKNKDHDLLVLTFPLNHSLKKRYFPLKKIFDQITNIKSTRFKVPVFIKLNMFHASESFNKFLTGFFMGMANWYGLDGAIIDSSFDNTVFSILKASEIFLG